MQNNGISIIVVSWNTKSITDRCLGYIKDAIDYSAEKIRAEVIVVDNNSDDGTPGLITKKYPWVKLAESKTNLGYAKGNNFGFKKTNPENKYLLLLNSDAFIEKDTLEKSLRFFEQKGDCGVLGCRLNYENGKFQPSAGLLPSPLSVFSWMMGLDKIPLIKYIFPGVHPRFKSFFSGNREVGWLMGAYLFMKREVFEKTEGFDENFFMYMEEVEWARRVKKLGYKIFYTPEFSVTHLEKASAITPEHVGKIYGQEITGLLYYLKKYYGNEIPFLKLIIRIGVSMRLFAFFLLGNKLRVNSYSEILKEIK